MKVFVSGAAGFIGKAVVAELAKRGHEVVGLVRDEAKGKHVEAVGGRYVVGDLTKEGPWTDEVKSSYRVISLTYPVKYSDKVRLGEMPGLNVLHSKAVTNLIKAARHGEAKSVIVTYDSACFGEKAGRWIEEPSAFRPTGYCKPIGNVFDEITRAGEEAGIPLVNVFPGLVYGPGGWFKYMAERVGKWTWRLAGVGDNLISVVHVSDLAWTYGEAAERLTHSESIAVADGTPITQAEFTNYLADALGTAHPKPLDYLKFAEAEGVMLAEALASSSMVSASKAVKVLDFKPIYHNFRRGIIAALKEMGIAPSAKAA